MCRVGVGSLNHQRRAWPRLARLLQSGVGPEMACVASGFVCSLFFTMGPTNRVNFSTAEMPVARSFFLRPAFLPFFEMWPELSADEAPLSLLVFQVRARTMATVCARV